MVSAAKAEHNTKDQGRDMSTQTEAKPGAPLAPPSKGYGAWVLAMLFISPGRHAGPGGDIARICEAAEVRCPGLRTHGSDLFATHPGVIDLLAQRCEEGLASEPAQGEIAAPGVE